MSPRAGEITTERISANQGGLYARLFGDVVGGVIAPAVRGANRDKQKRWAVMCRPDGTEWGIQTRKYKPILFVFRIAAKPDVAHRRSMTNKSSLSLLSLWERQYSSIPPVLHFFCLVIIMTDSNTDSPLCMKEFLHFSYAVTEISLCYFISFCLSERYTFSIYDLFGTVIGQNKTAVSCTVWRTTRRTFVLAPRTIPACFLLFLIAVCISLFHWILGTCGKVPVEYFYP